MALWWPCPCPRPPPLSSSLHSRHHRRHFISKTLIPTTTTSNNSSSVSVSASRICCYSSLQCSSASSGNSMESDTSPPTGVFIKGLPESMTEGRLKKAFSKFGEVVQVKIVVEKMSKQPLGSAFVWFTSNESANLAVEEMNGKVYLG